MRVLPLTILSVLAATLGLTGCATTAPERFYQLHAEAAARPAADHGPAILIGPLTLADYLDRETVVQRGADGSLTVDSGLRWAGSLKDDIAQLLLRQLSVRLGTSRVAVYPDRVGLRPEAQVRLNIGRLDSGPNQPAVLEAQWRLLDGEGELRASKVVRLEAPHDGSVTDQVRAQSSLLEQLSDQLAEAIRPITRARNRPANSVAGSQVESLQDGVLIPALPGLPPLRGEGEVFRF